MTLKIVSPSTPRSSKTKTCALAVFGLVRSVQARAAQIPCALAQIRNDIVQAWLESADAYTKNA